MWWLAVGAGGGKKITQRVVVTRWARWLAVGGRGVECNPPTSHGDSLGAVDGSGCGGGQKDRPTSRGDSLMNTESSYAR